MDLRPAGWLRAAYERGAIEGKTQSRTIPGAGGIDSDDGILFGLITLASHNTHTRVFSSCLP